MKRHPEGTRVKMKGRENNEEWQRPYVDCVLDRHNVNYGTSIIVVDRCESVYLRLQGGAMWDWVCRDEVREINVAAEVKLLTSQRLEDEWNSLWFKIGCPLEKSLSGKLPGTFHLHIGMTGERPELRGNTKRKLINDLEREITTVAPDLKDGESHGLLKKSMNSPSFAISKLNNSGSKLYRGITFAWFGHLLGSDELLMILKERIQKANRQLGEAKNRDISETFLIIIAGQYAKTRAYELQDKFRELAPNSCSNIDFCYYVEPKSPPVVHELSLSQPRR